MFERLLKKFLPVAFGVALQTMSANTLGASAVPSVVIAQVQAGSASGDLAATQEFISLYNNSNASVDVTNWCVSNKTGTSFACLGAPDVSTTLTLPSHTYALIASDTFATRFTGMYDTVFKTTNSTSGSLVGGSDTVTLMDANGATIDSINWTTSLTGGSALSRQWLNQSAGTMLDTDTSSDFKKVTPLIVPASGVVEETHIIDVCPNIEGVQPQLPSGYGISGGSCILDVCPNLDGLQAVLPTSMRIDDRGFCLYDLPHLAITEMLPNASGSDEGNEFIELFNQNAAPVDLSLYQLQVGPNFEKTYAFGAGTTIDAGAYKAFFNDSISFSLLNTSSRVRLTSIDGQVISESALYNNPADDDAWAFLGDTWMFTNQPTPGFENLLPTDDETMTNGTVSSSIKSCAANQYRNPDTNRCRSIITTAGTLAACKDGQYRSEETNRCRSIASDASSAKPCTDDQYRNPDTGRCKKIASEDELKDCGEGRERNPTTGRCRNVVTIASGKTPGGVSLVPAPTASILGWWAAAIVGIVALGYATLEWRKEIGHRVMPITSSIIARVASVRRRLSRLRYTKSNEDYRH